MATGSTYNVDILTQDGSKVVQAGEIQFLSSTNQPAVAPNTLYVKVFTIAYTAAGFATPGVSLYTPAIGDVIYDVGIGVTTAFNGTTPKLDVGAFSGTTGFFKQLAGNPADATKVYAGITNNTGFSSPNSALWLQAAVGSVGAAGTAAYVSTPIIVTAANPLFAVLSQDGTKGGTAPGGSAGVVNIYIVAGTPA